MVTAVTTAAHDTHVVPARRSGAWLARCSVCGTLAGGDETYCAAEAVAHEQEMAAERVAS